MNTRFKSGILVFVCVLILLPGAHATQYNVGLYDMYGPSDMDINAGDAVVFVDYDDYDNFIIEFDTGFGGANHFGRLRGLGWRHLHLRGCLSLRS